MSEMTMDPTPQPDQPVRVRVVCPACEGAACEHCHDPKEATCLATLADPEMAAKLAAYDEVVAKIRALCGPRSQDDGVSEPDDYEYIVWDDNGAEIIIADTPAEFIAGVWECWDRVSDLLAARSAPPPPEPRPGGPA